MTITNHILAGSMISAAVKEPALALPLALISHFVMDALPHFGYEGNKGYGEALKHRMSYWIAVLTLITTVLVVVLLVANHEWLALIAGVVASLPDAVGMYNYRKYEKDGKKTGKFIELFHVRFHRKIQRYERPWGVYVEILVFLILFFVLLKTNK